MTGSSSEENWKPGSTFRDADYAPEMVVIPAGAFKMGSPPDEEKRKDNEGPQFRVAFARPFALGKYAVTFEEFDHFVEAAGYHHRPEDEGWGRAKQPVIDLAWEDARAYTEWLSEETGAAYRLPSEAEWEYACRAGTKTPFHFGQTIDTSQANYDGNYAYGSSSPGEFRERTVEVGTFPENAFGLHEMHGNVWEWVEDFWNESYTVAPTNGLAWITGDSTLRILRGGTFFLEPRSLRSAYRGRTAPGIRGRSYGFRVARTLENTHP